MTTLPELEALLAAAIDARRSIEGMRIFVTSKERIKKPEGDDLFDASIRDMTKLHEALPALIAQARELAALKARIAEAPVVGDGHVLVALRRTEGYEDVHPQLLAEDAIDWPEYWTITDSTSQRVRLLAVEEQGDG